MAPINNYTQPSDSSEYFHAGSNSPAPENLEVEIAMTYEEFKKSVIEEYNSIKGSLTKEILFFEKYKKIPLNYRKSNVIELMYS